MIGDRPDDAPSPAATIAPALAALLPELKLLIGLATTALIIAGLYFGREILMPLALALLLCFVLDPLVVRLKRLGLPRAPAVLLVAVLTLALLGGAGLLLSNQVSVLSSELPTYQTNIQAKLAALRERSQRPGMFDGVFKTLDTLKAEVDRSASAGVPDGAGKKGTAPLAPVRVQMVDKQPTAFDQVLPWLEASGGPLATAGLVLVFMILALLDRQDLRDRLLRLWGGSLHRSTDAMDEAGERITKYLTMQLIVNLSYGVPMAAGLWFIGVPGALLWGAVAAVMRFIPYIGPLISSVFPLALAFALDPGWSMLLWTGGLILTLEMISNNLVEPRLYGSSTGLSAISLMVAATFWTAIWGPVGLIMSTPLTVCLLVVGRHLPRLKFLDVLLGSQPALSAPARLYQRLLAGDVEEAIELASEQASDNSVEEFYNQTGLSVLRMASSDHAEVASAEHRHRLVMGMDALIDDLEEQFPPSTPAARPVVVCIGGKWEVDALAARMLAHSLSRAGQPAEHRSASAVTADYISHLDLRGARTVCLSYFSADPKIQARHFCRRLRRRWPDIRIVLALWNAPPELLDDDALVALGADAVATSLTEAAMRVAHLLGQELSDGFLPAPIPANDLERVNALRASGALDTRAHALFDQAAKRAADIFDVPLAMVSLISEDIQTVSGSYGKLPAPEGRPGLAVTGADLSLPRTLSICGHVVANDQTLVVPDIERDMRFAENPALESKGVRFYAGAPLRDQAGFVLGTLCILGVEPRVLDQREVRLLEAMAGDVMESLRDGVVQWGPVPPPLSSADDTPSAIVGQVLPAAG